MYAVLWEQPIVLTGYDEPPAQRLIERGTAHKNKFTVNFKSGSNDGCREMNYILKFFLTAGEVWPKII